MKTLNRFAFLLNLLAYPAALVYGLAGPADAGGFLSPPILALIFAGVASINLAILVHPRKSQPLVMLMIAVNGPLVFYAATRWGAASSNDVTWPPVLSVAVLLFAVVNVLAVAGKRP